MKDIGQRLSYYRKKAGYKQKEASNLLQIPAYVLSNYETDRSEPDIDTLLKMSSLYKTTIDELVGNSYVDEPINDKRYQELVRLISNQVGDKRKEAIELTITILKKVFN